MRHPKLIVATKVYATPLIWIRMMMDPNQPLQLIRGPETWADTPVLSLYVNRPYGSDCESESEMDCAPNSTVSSSVPVSEISSIDEVPVHEAEADGQEQQEDEEIASCEKIVTALQSSRQRKQELIMARVDFRRTLLVEEVYFEWLEKRPDWIQIIVDGRVTSHEDKMITLNKLIADAVSEEEADVPEQNEDELIASRESVSTQRQQKQEVINDLVAFRRALFDDDLSYVVSLEKRPDWMEILGDACRKGSYEFKTHTLGDWILNEYDYHKIVRRAIIELNPAVDETSTENNRIDLTSDLESDAATQPQAHSPNFARTGRQTK